MNNLEDVSWYHGKISRHIAEALLMSNGQEGSYLIRDGSEPQTYSISVRGKESVKHFKVEKDANGYKFGITAFDNLESLIRHFANQPLLGGTSGVFVLLTHPYPKAVEEPDNYESIVLQSTYRSGATEKDLDDKAKANSLASKEGFLTKQGWYVKNWKTRWFVLNKYELSYYADRGKTKPIRTLNLEDCQHCSADDTTSKSFCFRLEYPDRTWFMYAATKQEQEEWLNIIKWKMEEIKSRVANH